MFALFVCMVYPVNVERTKETQKLQPDPDLSMINQRKYPLIGQSGLVVAGLIKIGVKTRKDRKLPMHTKIIYFLSNIFCIFIHQSFVVEHLLTHWSSVSFLHKASLISNFSFFKVELKKISSAVKKHKNRLFQIFMSIFLTFYNVFLYYTTPYNHSSPPNRLSPKHLVQFSPSIYFGSCGNNSLSFHTHISLVFILFNKLCNINNEHNWHKQIWE